jgi:hypothetical protein
MTLTSQATGANVKIRCNASAGAQRCTQKTTTYVNNTQSAVTAECGSPKKRAVINEPENDASKTDAKACRVWRGVNWRNFE